MSYTNMIYHLVFRTKDSSMSIPEENEGMLYRYLWGYIKNRKSVLYRIGGMPDHIHILLSLHPDYAFSSFVRDMKRESSKWMIKNKQFFPDFCGWGESYAAFTYSISEKDTVLNYIKGQKEHHRAISFAEEYREFIVQNGGIIDENTFLKR